MNLFTEQPPTRSSLLTLKLLDNLPAWRMRAIERIMISKAMWSEREREIHVKPLEEVSTNSGSQDWRIPGLTEDLDELKKDGNIELVLPITELPKIPLLDLHITVNGERRYRVRLDDSARIQACHIQHLSEKIGKPIENPHLIELLAAIFYFPTSTYDKIWQRRRHSWIGFFSKRIHERIVTRSYLRSDTRLQGAARSGLSDYWYDICYEIREIVKKYAPKEHLSGASNPIIALPYFVNEWARLKQEQPEREGVSTETITGLLWSLQALLVKAREISRESPHPEQREAADKLLSSYATYGYRWMAFARCTVPVAAPFVITINEQRSIHFQYKRRKYRSAGIFLWKNVGKTAWKMVSFRDAETNHVSIRVADTAVRLDNCQPLGVADGVPDLDEQEAEIDDEEGTFELYLRHSSFQRRPERIWIKCNLRLARVISFFHYLAMAVTAAGIGLLFWRGVLDERVLVTNPPTRQEYTHGLTAKDASVILIPVAFVASFLLVKDSSTLVMRIRWLRQVALLIELFILLALASSLYAWRLIWASP
ncbi:hypothetical protein ABZ845_05615 [Streptomyces sp. NPDC047022]|uniref:hypothetical protein n=1 Tax=Streptomyces sp. NPDC047022 TaxID=3155737 RepID=UPI0033E06961